MSESGCVDWSNLPPDTIHLVFKKLDDISDFIRFRAVCPRWRSSASIFDTPPQIPWFLEAREYQSDNYLSFYSLCNNKAYRICCSNSSGRSLLGPAHDYVVSVNSWKKTVSLLNPLTNNEVSLPDLDITQLSIVKIDPDPIQIGKNIVLSGVKYHHGDKLLALYEPIEKKWNVIELDFLKEEDPTTDCYFKYYNGMYYLYETDTRITKIIDVNTKSIKYTIPSPIDSDTECDSDDDYSLAQKANHDNSVYLVESSGEILIVFLHNDYFSSYCNFRIFRLDLGNENIKPCWIEIDSIGDQILFLSFNNGLSFCANDFKGFTGDSIYFMKSEKPEVEKEIWYFKADKYPGYSFPDLFGPGPTPPTYPLYRYDINQATTEKIDCPLLNGGTWIVPSLR